MAFSSRNIDYSIKFHGSKYGVWILHLQISDLLWKRGNIKSALKLTGELPSGRFEIICSSREMAVSNTNIDYSIKF
jgi:hypothetical protein